MTSPVAVQTIANELIEAGLPVEISSGALTMITGIQAIENAGPGDLTFMDKKEYLDVLLQQKPSAVVTSKALAPLLTDAKDLAVIVSPNVALAHAFIKMRHAGRDYTKSGWSQIHPSSVIHESAQIDGSVVIEPRAVIGARVKIGKNCRVMAGAIVENDVTIGDGTVLHPACVVGYGSILGTDVVVGPGSILGSEGYGFAQDQKRRSFPIPQTGIVVLEDRVRVGANCCVDRATYRETRIRQGTKLDNLCHIAHNVEIGEDCLLTSMFCVAGSTKIGNRVIASGQSGVIDHITICDDAVLLHRAGVTKDIEKPGAYAGLPTQPIGDYMKNMAVLRAAVELKKRVTDLEAKTDLTPV